MLCRFAVKFTKTEAKRMLNLNKVDMTCHFFSYKQISGKTQFRMLLHVCHLFKQLSRRKTGNPDNSWTTSAVQVGSKTLISS